MDLGWCDVCLRVVSARTSREFYAKLGFYRVEGDDAEGWAVVTNGDLRLGFFEERYMGDGAISLNFRGGNVAEIRQTLEERGLTFNSPAGTDKSGRLRILRDPDGYSIFFDTAPGETKKTEAI